MKKLYGLILLSILFASNLFAQTQVTIMSPTLLRINYGDSFLALNLAPHHANANLFQVRYAPSPTCPIAPQVSLQVRYDGNQNWYNTTVEQNGIFRHSGFQLNAIKLLFRQLNYQSVDCEMSIVGTVSP